MIKKRANFWQKINPEMFDETVETISHHTKDIAIFVKGMRHEDLPEKAITDAKRLILDTIGCAAAGRDTRSSKISRNIVTKVLHFFSLHNADNVIEL